MKGFSYIHWHIKWLHGGIPYHNRHQVKLGKLKWYNHYSKMCNVFKSTECHTVETLLIILMVLSCAIRMRWGMHYLSVKIGEGAWGPGHEISTTRNVPGCVQCYKKHTSVPGSDQLLAHPPHTPTCNHCQTRTQHIKHTIKNVLCLYSTISLRAKSAKLPATVDSL